MPTRRDVANRAGTSEAVVSYVLNGGPRGVAPATRDRVLAAVAELGYRPNAVARSLRTRRTMIFGLLVPDNSNPFFAELARSIEDAGFEQGYTMLLGNAMDDDQREAAYVRSLLDRQVDGLMIVPAHGAGSWVAEVSQRSVPTLLLDREPDVPGTTRIIADHAGGAYLGTRHLIEHGRRRIGCVAGTDQTRSGIERVDGWRHAIEEAGLNPAEQPLIRLPYDRAEGYRAGRELLGAHHVDALFVTSDEQAIGVLRAAADLGIDIPDDVALCSFDGIETGAYLAPPLTTVRQPLDVLGRYAVEWLADQAAGPNRAPERIVVDTGLVIRHSCGCPEAAQAHG